MDDEAEEEAQGRQEGRWLLSQSDAHERAINAAKHLGLEVIRPHDEFAHYFQGQWTLCKKMVLFSIGIPDIEILRPADQQLVDDLVLDRIAEQRGAAENSMPSDAEIPSPILTYFCPARMLRVPDNQVGGGEE